MSDYGKMTDEQLICNLRAGEQEITDYIMDKYKFLVKKKAKEMYLLGGENDDLIQEGMIGLFKAVRDYDSEQGTSFASFADLCISRQMYSAIKASQRQKHMPLNSYISLYEQGEDTQEEKQQPLIETIQTMKDNNPEELFLNKEYLQMIEQELKQRLSDLENRVLHLHLLGIDYQTISKLLDSTAYCRILSQHKLVATGTTGKLIAEATGLQVQRFLAGVQGGDQQIASRIACNEIDLLLFFRDPINAKPSDCLLYTSRCV